MNKIDMHIHTNASDGIFSPTEIVDWSVRLGLKGIAITDHDTIDGIEEALIASKKYSEFLIIPGIELNTIYNNEEIHLLGYFIQHTNNDIIQTTKAIKNHRLKRAHDMIKKLNAMHFNITFSEVQRIAKNGAIGRPHIARILVHKGYTTSVEEAFQKFLQKGRPAYVERFKLTIEEGIEMISKAKGVPVLAHPGLMDQSIDIRTLIHKGIKGIEVYHIKHSDLQQQEFLQYAKENHLFITGGSDYHDHIVKGVPSIGRVTVPYHSIIEMKRRFSKKE